MNQQLWTRTSLDIVFSSICSQFLACCKKNIHLFICEIQSKKWMSVLRFCASVFSLYEHLKLDKHNLRWSIKHGILYWVKNNLADEAVYGEN